MNAELSDYSGDIVGRATELAAFGDVVAQLAAGRGRSVLVEGEPGIGKSALVAAGLVGAEQIPGCVILRGACDELGQWFPLSVMLQALGVDARSGDPLRAAAAAALALPSMGDGTGSGWSVTVSAGDPVVAAVEQLSALVDRLCAAGPVVLVVDDLHWADDASLLLWQRLSRATDQLPLLLVGVCRPVPRREELDRLRRDLQARDGVVITLDRLAGEGVSALAHRLAGGSPGPGLAARLESAAGNPLYVRELLDALSRAGALALSGGVVELFDTGDPGEQGGQEDAALVSLAAVIESRLDFLSEDTRVVLRSAALLGTDFSVADLAGLVVRSAGALLGVVEEAMAGVLESVGARLRFRHGLLKQALYESVPPALRAWLHRQAAESAQPSRITGTTSGRPTASLTRYAIGRSSPAGRGPRAVRC